MPWYVIWDGDDDDAGEGTLWHANDEDHLCEYLDEFCDSFDKEPKNVRIAELKPSRRVTVTRMFDIEKKRKK